MKKLLLILILFALAGCSPKPQAPTYEIDTSMLAEKLYVDTFDISQIKIIVTNADGSMDTVSATNAMLFQSDIDKLTTPGTHTITIMFRGITKEITITILDDEPIEFIRDLVVEVIDIGQGDAIYIGLPNGEDMMIDVGQGVSGSWDRIDTTLQKYEVTTIHHLIITHNHADHYGFVPTLLDNYAVENIYGSGSTRTNVQFLSIMKAIADANNELLVVEVGDMIIEEQGLKLQVVATQRIENETNPNISSVMVKLTYLNNSFMFTGDAGVATSLDGEHTALASGIDLQSDVLKVGHHGSQTSSSPAFLAAVQPLYAVMTTVEGSTTLPHPDAVARILAVGAILYDTKVHGNVIFISDGNEITIQTAK